MRILSFDIGIKNLGYCILENNNENDNNLNIIDWNIINLCNIIPFCNCCKKQAKFKKNNIAYCKIHTKNSNYEISNIDLKKISKENMKFLLKLANEYNIDFDSDLIKNKNDILDIIKDFVKNNYLEPIEILNANEINLIDLGINLSNELDILSKKIDFSTIDAILLENQISPIANRMKTIQGMIAQYFIIKKVYNIKFISAANKLKPFIDNKKTSYNERKKLSIDFTRNFLLKNNFEEKIIFFSNNNKKDDLADSFLQGLYYLITFDNFKLN